jgi:hypothetical protein
LFGGLAAKKQAGFDGSAAAAAPAAPAAARAQRLDVDRDAASGISSPPADAFRESTKFSISPRVSTYLLASQTADGAFEGDVEFDGDARDHLERLVAEWLGGPPAANVLTTVAAIVCLRSRYPGERGLWRRAERKALRWLADAVQRPQADVDAWLDSLVKDPQLSSAPAR